MGFDWSLKIREKMPSMAEEAMLAWNRLGDVEASEETRESARRTMRKLIPDLVITPLDTLAPRLYLDEPASVEQFKKVHRVGHQDGSLSWSRSFEEVARQREGSVMLELISKEERRQIPGNLINNPLGSTVLFSVKGILDSRILPDEVADEVFLDRSPEGMLKLANLLDSFVKPDLIESVQRQEDLANAIDQNGFVSGAFRGDAAAIEARLDRLMYRDHLHVAQAVEWLRFWAWRGFGLSGA